MGFVNTIGGLVIVGAVGWYGYNYAIAAPAALDQSLDNAADMFAGAQPDGTASDAAKTCFKDEVKTRLPSLYGWGVKSRLALRDAAVGALGNPPTDVYWSYAMMEDFASSGKSSSDAMQEVLTASAQKCQSVS